jgi:hypothetical protein
MTAVVSIRNWAVILADGGYCLGDLAAVRDQAAVFGQVAAVCLSLR